MITNEKSQVELKILYHTMLLGSGSAICLCGGRNEQGVYEQLMACSLQLAKFQKTCYHIAQIVVYSHQRTLAMAGEPFQGTYRQFLTIEKI